MTPQPPVRERRTTKPVEPPAPATLEDFPLLEEEVDVTVAPPAQPAPRKTARAPKVEPVEEFEEISFIEPIVEPEPEPEIEVEKPAPVTNQKRRPPVAPAAPEVQPAPTAKEKRKPPAEPAAEKRRRPAASATMGAAPLTPSVGDVAVVSQVTKTYDQPRHVEALRGVSLSVQQGRLTAILGRSGAGKSTLLRLMAGIETPTSGTITVAGQDLSSMKERQLDKFRRDSVGFVFRSFNLLDSLNVADNIKMASAIKKEPLDQGWYDQVVAALGLTDQLTKKPASLSLGEQQRVALARALSTKPSVIFADEPTGDCDAETADEVLGYLRTCVSELRATVVVATHDAAVAACADQVWVLGDGSVVEQVQAPTLARVMDALRAVSGGAQA